MIQQLAIRLLGFEPKQLQRAHSSEHVGIAVVVVSSLVVLICAAIATYVLGIFISGSLWIALPIAALGTFVLFSIFRFSLILIKPRIGLVDRLNEVLLKPTLSEYWLAIRNGFKRLVEGKLFRHKLSSHAIPGFTLIFRSIYLALIACVLIFPLTVLVQWNESMQFNKELRQAALQTYLDRNNTRVKVYDKHDEQTRKQAYQLYVNEVNHSFYTMRLLERGMEGAAFVPITVFIIICFVLPHVILFNLMRKPGYTYIQEVQDYYQTIITQDFAQLNQEAGILIATKNKTGHTLDLSFLTKGNPYLTKEQDSDSPKTVDWNTWQRIINPSLFSVKQ